MVGSQQRALFELNETTGVGTRVGNATNFGVNETSPRGLASHNGKLYMVGSSTNNLYELNTVTGVGTRVGNSDNFGVSETNAQGLASQNNDLYMYGEGTDSVYTLDVSTGQATLVRTIDKSQTSAFAFTGLVFLQTLPNGLNLVNDISPIYDEIENISNIGFIGIVDYTENNLGSTSSSLTVPNAPYNLASYNYNSITEKLTLNLTGTVRQNSFSVFRIQRDGSDTISLNSSDATFRNNSFVWDVPNNPTNVSGRYRFIFQDRGTGINSVEWVRVENSNYEIDIFNNKRYLKLLPASRVANGNEVLVIKEGLTDA